MRWSVRLMVIGVLVILVGFLPIYFSGLTIGTLESAASFFAVGLLILLVGIMLRTLRKTFQPGP